MTQTPADIARCGHIILFLREQLEHRGWTVRDLSLAGRAECSASGQRRSLSRLLCPRC